MLQGFRDRLPANLKELEDYMNQKRLEEISRALAAKGVDRACPRCGNPEFSVVAEFSIVLEESQSSYSMGGRSIPTVIVGCDKCGYIAQHALGALGLAKCAKE
jgi:hypothetical protein